MEQFDHYLRLIQLIPEQARDVPKFKSGINTRAHRLEKLRRRYHSQEIKLSTTAEKGRPTTKLVKFAPEVLLGANAIGSRDAGSVFDDDS